MRLSETTAESETDFIINIIETSVKGDNISSSL